MMSWENKRYVKRQSDAMIIRRCLDNDLIHKGTNMDDKMHIGDLKSGF